MDDTRRQKIIELAKRAHDTAAHYRALGMMNTAGKTPSELQQQSIDYALAAAEAADARQALDEAIGAGPLGIEQSFAGRREQDTPRTIYEAPTSPTER